MKEEILCIIESFYNPVQKRLRKRDEAFSWTDSEVGMFWACKCRRKMEYDKLRTTPTNVKRRKKSKINCRGVIVTC